jgi:hypothetical protein
MENPMIAWQLLKLFVAIVVMCALPVILLVYVVGYGLFLFAASMYGLAVDHHRKAHP